MSFSQVLLFTLGCGAIVATLFLALHWLFAATASRGHRYPPPPHLAPAACVHCGHAGPLTRPLATGLAKACVRCGR